MSEDEGRRIWFEEDLAEGHRYVSLIIVACCKFFTLIAIHPNYTNVIFHL